MGELSGVTGYGIHTLQVVRGLINAGLHVSVRPSKVSSIQKVAIDSDILSKVVHQIQPEDWEILIAPSHTIPTPGRRVIFWTMHESTKLPKESVEKLNMARVVVVPNVWNKRVFTDCGVSVPIEVIPLGVDPDVFKPTKMHMEGPCIFGAAGKLTNGRARKGIDDVIGCFYKAFPRTLDVKLIVKLHPDCPDISTPDPRVFIMRDFWDEPETAWFLDHITCFVSASRGEGWGLWQRQALQCGRPVIASLYAGLEDLDKSGCYSIPFTEVDAEWPGGGRWCKPDLTVMSDEMRRVYIDRVEAMEKGELAGSQAVWAESVNMLVKLMDQLGV